MALSVEWMNEIMDRHFAYEAADDVDGVLTTLADDVEHDLVGAPTGPTIGPDAGHPFGMDGRGRPLEFRLLHVVEGSDVGRIRRENVWLDFPAIMQQLADA